MKAILIAAAMLLQPAPPSVGDLAWLEGHWRAERPILPSGPDFTEEIWSGVAAETMIGLGRTVRGRQLAAYEFMRIERDAQGRAALFASPGGLPPVRFELVEAGPGRAAFENRAHDYPQRISYLRVGDRLTATTSLADGSQADSWTYVRQLPR